MTDTLTGLGTELRRKNHGRNHSYWEGDTKFDGVTTLIGDGMRKKALEQWNARVTAEYAVDHFDELAGMTPSQRLKALAGAANANRDEAARRGTEIHRLAELLLAGEEVDVPEEIRGHVESAVRFLDEWKFEPILTETSVFNKTHRYGGTLDIVGVSRTSEWDGHVAIVDWKSGRSGIFGETSLQLTAYEHAEVYLDENGIERAIADLGITDAWAVWVRADGYSVKPVRHDESVFDRFLKVAASARATGRDDMNDLVGDELFRPTAA